MTSPKTREELARLIGSAAYKACGGMSPQEAEAFGMLALEVMEAAGVPIGYGVSTLNPRPPEFRSIPAQNDAS